MLWWMTWIKVDASGRVLGAGQKLTGEFPPQQLLRWNKEVAADRVAVCFLLKHFALLPRETFGDNLPAVNPSAYDMAVDFFPQAKSPQRPAPTPQPPPAKRPPPRKSFPYAADDE